MLPMNQGLPIYFSTKERLPQKNVFTRTYDEALGEAPCENRRELAEKKGRGTQGGRGW